MARKWDRNKYNIWMRKVDEAIAAKCGLGHLDLSDYLYADAFVAGRSPEAVAKAALRADGFPLHEYRG